MSTIDIIVSLLNEQGKSQKELCDYLGITKNAFTDWKSGRIRSYHKHLDKIAEFFGVSVDYLLGKEKTAPEGTVDSKKQRFITLWDALPEDKKDLVLNLLESLTKDNQ